MMVNDLGLNMQHQKISDTFYRMITAIDPRPMNGDAPDYSELPNGIFQWSPITAKVTFLVADNRALKKVIYIHKNGTILARSFNEDKTLACQEITFPAQASGMYHVAKGAKTPIGVKAVFSENGLLLHRTGKHDIAEEAAFAMFYSSDILNDRCLERQEKQEITFNDHYWIDTEKNPYIPGDPKYV